MSGFYGLIEDVCSLQPSVVLIYTALTDRSLGRCSVLTFHLYGEWRGLFECHTAVHLVDL